MRNGGSLLPARVFRNYWNGAIIYGDWGKHTWIPLHSKSGGNTANAQGTTPGGFQEESGASLEIFRCFISSPTGARDILLLPDGH